MKSRLDQIEEHLQRFIENSVQLLPWGNRQPLLARRLVSALQESLSIEENGSPVATGVYTIYLSPESLSFWLPRQALFDALAQVLNEFAEDAGLRFTSPPVIRLSGDASLPPEEFRVVAGRAESPLGRTDVLPVLPDSRHPHGLPKNAYLILDGVETFALRQTVISIGRRTDNHLIIDDPRVSRTHAQIRATRGHYVLFDLNSTGGTFVNGQRVTNHSLKPGDVISLAGYVMIYGEDPQGPGDTGSQTASWPTQSE